MANCIPNNIFDDNETKHVHVAKKSQSNFTFKQPDMKDLDCGSVSSGSEKDGDMHFHTIQQHPKNFDSPESPIHPQKYSPDSNQQNNNKNKAPSKC